MVAKERDLLDLIWELLDSVEQRKRLPSDYGSSPYAYAKLPPRTASRLRRLEASIARLNEILEQQPVPLACFEAILCELAHHVFAKGKGSGALTRWVGRLRGIDAVTVRAAAVIGGVFGPVKDAPSNPGLLERSIDKETVKLLFLYGAPEFNDALRLSCLDILDTDDFNAEVKNRVKDLVNVGFDPYFVLDDGKGDPAYDE
jgi:hypothetical protein